MDAEPPLPAMHGPPPPEPVSQPVGPFAAGSIPPPAGAPIPEIRIVTSGKPDVVIQLPGIAGALFEELSARRKPSSGWKSAFKDIVPGLTSLAAVLISLAALMYTNEQKRQDVLRGIIQNVVKTPAPGGNQESNLELSEIAAYGLQALPAVRMALASGDDTQRYRGVLLAQQIYRAAGVDHETLTRQILSYYGAGTPQLRQGVLQWLVEMGHELSEEEKSQAVRMLKSRFGPDAQDCNKEDPRVALATTNFLMMWPSEETENLLQGMGSNCADSDVSTEARDHLERMKKQQEQNSHTGKN